MSKPPCAFIIHGHDLDARDELAEFVRAAGLDVLHFDLADSEAGRIETILSKVLNGIRQADVVIVLLTPDEQAALHDPRTGDYMERSARNEELGGWQPRPNVLFEAGVAIGAAESKTILVKLGPVRAISDLGGVKFVDLDSDNAKQQLLRAFSRIIGDDFSPPPRAKRNVSGRFECRRVRWGYHDEFGELERRLDGLMLDGFNKSLLGVLIAYVKVHPHPESWNSTDIIDFIFERYTKGSDVQCNEAANGLFWYLIIYGVFSLNDIVGWDNPRKKLDWVYVSHWAYLTARGKALLKKHLDLSAE